jgi:DNA-binding HxlR family transcriptional regulator
VKHPLNKHLCPNFQAAMEVLSRPWNGLIMATLQMHGLQRYSELRARLDAMGDRMLSMRLKELEERGLVLRRVQEGPPVRVAYELSETGRGFRDVAMALSGWGQRLAPAPPKRRKSR